MRYIITIMIITFHVGLSGHALGNGEITLTTTFGKRVTGSVPVFHCACEDQTHGIRSRTSSKKECDAQLFVRMKEHIAIIDFSDIKSFEFLRHKNNDRNQKHRNILIIMSDNTEIRGMLINDGLLTMQVRGHSLDIQVDEIQRVEILQGFERSRRSVSSGRERAQLVLQVNPKYKSLSLYQAGFFSRLRCPEGCEIPEKLSDSLKLEDGRRILLTEIRSLMTFNSSSRIRQSNSLRLQLKNGEVVHVNHIDARGILGTATIGSAKILILVDFAQPFRFDF